MWKAGVARDKIKHVTGHKSTLSIKSCDDGLSDNEQIEFSDIPPNTRSTTQNVISPANVKIRMVQQLTRAQLWPFQLKKKKKKKSTNGQSAFYNSVQ